ncbi:MAG: M28 family metallopeptidase [Promethearchaeota archaeon]
MSADFDEKVLMEVVADVSYPRLVGTPGEKKVIEYTKGAFKDRGFQEVQAQEFTFSRFYGGTMVQLLAFALTFFLLNFSILLLFNPALNVFLVVAFLVVAYFFLKAYKKPEDLKSQLATTENVFAKVPAKSTRRGTIVLSAHHDSKGQNYITVVRAALFLFGIVLGLVNLLVVLLSLVLVLFRVNPPVFFLAVGAIAGIAASVLFFALVFNAVNNKSCGAIDNATGMAIVLELARAINERGGLENYDLVAAIFSAEEYGMMGSRYWLNEYGDGCGDPASCFNFNFDMVIEPINYMAQGGLGKKPVNKVLNELFDRVATKMGVPVSGFWLPVGAATDRFNFSRRGWEAMDVVTRKAANYAHSYTDDTIDKVSPRALRQACEVTFKCILEIDAGKV